MNGHNTPPKRHERMTARELAAALAERAEDVCRRYLPGGRKEGRYWKAGNVRGDAGRSLFVGLAPSALPGRWQDAATGEGGDLLGLLRRQFGDAAFAEARAFVDRCGSVVSCPGGRRGARATDTARRMWDMCRPLEGTRADAYLRARRITPGPVPALRFHPALFYRDGSDSQGFRKLPAMVARATNHRGDFVGVHRTYLDPDCPAKAPVATPRKSLGAIGGAAVYLGERQSILLVAEGIETALSLRSARPGLFAAAALSAGSLAGFTPPTGVTGLVIARDRDHAGSHAAERLRARCERGGIEVLVIAPRCGSDFNDELRPYGPDGMARLVCGAIAEFEDPKRGAWAESDGGRRDRWRSSRT